MSKKKRKQAKKRELAPFANQAQLKSLVDSMIGKYAPPTLHVRLGYEGKLYEGDIPCVGVDE